MAKLLFVLSKEQNGLHRAKGQTENVQVLKRLQAVRLCGSGYAVSVIQAITGCKRAGVDGLVRHVSGCWIVLAGISAPTSTNFWPKMTAFRCGISRLSAVEPVGARLATSP